MRSTRVQSLITPIKVSEGIMRSQCPASSEICQALKALAEGGKLWITNGGHFYWLALKRVYGDHKAALSASDKKSGTEIIHSWLKTFIARENFKLLNNKGLLVCGHKRPECHSIRPLFEENTMQKTWTNFSNERQTDSQQVSGNKLRFGSDGVWTWVQVLPREISLSLCPMSVLFIHRTSDKKCPEGEKYLIKIILYRVISESSLILKINLPSPAR